MEDTDEEEEDLDEEDDEEYNYEYCSCSIYGTIFLFYTSGTKEKTTTYVKQLFDTNFDNGIQLSDSVE